jgi:hypothetical protein
MSAYFPNEWAGKESTSFLSVHSQFIICILEEYRASYATDKVHFSEVTSLQLSEQLNTNDYSYRYPHQFAVHIATEYYEVHRKVPGLGERRNATNSFKIISLGNVYSDPTVCSTLQKHRGRHFP